MAEAVGLAKTNPNVASESAAGAEGARDERWMRVMGLGCDLSVDLPLPHFKIADLLKLRQGSVIDAHWKVGQDVPLSLNGTVMGWVEFEVVASNLAVRLTDLV
jgi:flagellar motor switch/type III secretory pathway protein FliN